MRISYDKLRDHQKEMYEVSQTVFDKKDLMVVDIAPGGGKTIGSLYIADNLNWMRRKIIVVVPKDELVKQWHNVAKKSFGLDLIEGFQYDSKAFKQSDGFVMTYAALINKWDEVSGLCELYNIFAILDEAHHLSDNEDKAWGVSVNKAFIKAKKVIMLTGTPWRHGRDDVLHLERDSEGYAKIDFQFLKRNLLGESLRWTQFQGFKAKNIEIQDTETGEIIKVSDNKEAADHLGKDDIYGTMVRFPKRLTKMFKKADKKLSSIRKSTMELSNAGGLIVCADTAHAHVIQKMIKVKTGRDYPIVHSKDKTSPDKIARFRKDDTKWIIAVDMIAEGVDIPRLQVCIYLSAKRTKSWIWQVVGRAERLNPKHKDITEARAAYFYYVHDDGKLDDIIRDIENEQAHKENIVDYVDNEITKKTIGNTKTAIEPTHILYDFLNEDGDILIDGLIFKMDDPIVQYALRFVDNPDTAAYDFKIQYAFAKAWFESQNNDDIMNNVDEDELTSSEQRDILRTQIDSELKRKVVPFCKTYSFSVNEVFPKVNAYLNRVTDVKSIGDSDTYDLEKRLRLISTMDLKEVIYRG